MTGYQKTISNIEKEINPMTDTATNNPNPEPITKEELTALEAETLEFPFYIIDQDSSDEEIAAAMARLSREEVLGFDTETKPSFQKGVHYKVALLQLSSATEVVLIRLSTFEDRSRLAPVGEVLSNKDILKVGVAIHDDAVGLAKDHDLWCHNCLDLRTLAKGAGITVLSLSKIYATLFGKRISKGQRLTDWEAKQLSESQARYGALDAWAGRQIYVKLQDYCKPEMIERELLYHANTTKTKSNTKGTKGKGRSPKTQSKKIKNTVLKNKTTTPPASDER